MNNRLTRIVLIALFAILQVSCGGGGGSGGGAASCKGAVTELEGGWEYCSVTTGDYISYTFTNNCVTVNVKDYTNNDCTGSITYDESASYPFVLGSTVITDGGQMAREIDVDPDGVTQYDIYLLDSNIFYRGLPTATNNLSSPSARPTSINFSIPYTPVP